MPGSCRHLDSLCGQTVGGPPFLTEGGSDRANIALSDARNIGIASMAMACTEAVWPTVRFRSKSREISTMRAARLSSR